MKPDDFANLDPPYYSLGETSGFTTAGFGHADQLALRGAIPELHHRTDVEACIMLSNNSAPPLLDRYGTQPEGFRIYEVTAVRSVGPRAHRGVR